MPNRRPDHHQLRRAPPNGSVRDRISQLETLIVSLKSSLEAEKRPAVNQNTEIISSGDPGEVRDFLTSSGMVELLDDQTHISPKFGHIGLENSETSYVGSDHWMAILNEVSFLGSLLTASNSFIL